jgi:hypothetical protein
MLRVFQDLVGKAGFDNMAVFHHDSAACKLTYYT